MDDVMQEKYFSGKKSNHTFKSQLVILPSGQDIVDVVAGEPGPKSDITLFRENRDTALAVKLRLSLRAKTKI